VITGAGEAFSAGGDIADFDRLTDVPSYRRQVRLALRAFASLERCQTITIAAVNGLAFGGGTELTLACDLALAATGARFAFREVSVGLMPGYGLVRGPETVGRAWTRWLALTGEEIEAEQALKIGLVHRVVAPERLVEEALAVAGRIAANPTVAVQMGKQFLNRDMASVDEVIDATALLFNTAEHKERIRAFLETRAGRDRS
jgi:enoyl-CoA hydratase